MIAADIRIDLLDGAHWTRLLELAQPGADSTAPAPLLLVFVEDGRVVRAVKPRIGRVEGVEWNGPTTDLAALRARHGARRVIVFVDGAIAEALHQAESRLAYRQDYAEQLWHIVTAASERIGKDVFVDPAPWKVPALRWNVVQGIFDRLWPDGTSAAFYVVDEEADAIHTSVILHKQDGNVVRMTSHRALDAGLTLGRGWRTEYRRLATDIGTRVAPVHAALFTNLAGARGLVSGRASFPAVIQAREAILDPGPPWAVALAVGFYAWHLVSSAVSSFMGSRS